MTTQTDQTTQTTGDGLTVGEARRALADQHDKALADAALRGKAKALADADPLLAEGTGDELTVGELRRQLAERHGNALADTDKLLADVTVNCARQDTAQRMSRVAERLARNSSLLDRNAARLSTDENDPLAAVQRDVGALIDLFGIAEVLHGRGAKRVRKG